MSCEMRHIRTNADISMSQRAANLSDDDDDFVVSKPQARKPAVKKAKAAVDLPPSSDAMEMDAPPKKVRSNHLSDRIQSH